MTHDPERSSAAYLAGEMSRRKRRTFEEHILECEDCWREVDLARTGRSFAESGRELLPQPLRERIRAAVASLDPPRRGRFGRWRFGMALFMAMALGALGVVWGTVDGDQPPAIEALVSDFRGDPALTSNAAPRLPRRIGDLRLQRVRAGTVDGIDVTVHTYLDPAGHEVAVYHADRTFPVAEGAEHAPGGATWTAEFDGIVLFCSDHPQPSLVVGDDAKEVVMTARLLELR